MNIGLDGQLAHNITDSDRGPSWKESSRVDMQKTAMCPNE
jgi:hypothetical protein